MVLKIYSSDNIFVYKDIDRTFFRRRCAGGMKYLQFDISTKHSLYKYLAEEVKVEYDGDFYVVKGINERSKAKTCTINCELDLDGLHSEIITKTFTTESFYNICREILRGTGWKIIDAELVSKRTTLEVTDNTPSEILEKCTNSTAFGTCYEFDTKNKVITCIKPYNNTTPTGTYFTNELNLDDLNFKGSSSALVTKLYVYGKDGRSIASVNGGKEYLENYSYTNKVKAAVWRDERYTNPQSQKDDAEVMLEALANPERSYTLKVIDLAKAKPMIYGNLLAYDLYDIVTLVDRNRRTKSDLRIVELCEYPADHTLDTVTISNVAGRITGKLAAIENKFTQLDAQQLHDRTKINEIKQDLDTTVLHVAESWASSVNESLFTQTAEGIYLQVDQIVGTQRFGTLIQQSSRDIMISWNNISDYIKFESVNGYAQINFYNSPKTSSSQKPILSLDRTGEAIYDTSGSLLMKLDYSGESFYYKNNYVGLIGTTCYINDSNKRGLVFNLDHDAAYMAWCRDDNPQSNGYDMKLAYVKPNTTLGAFSGGSEKNTAGEYVGKLHTGCSLTLNNWYLHNAVLKDWAFEGGTITGTFSGYYVTSFNSDGTAATWKSFSLTFNKGILQKGSW